MWMPITRTRWLKQRTYYNEDSTLMRDYLRDTNETIRRNVDWLIEHLYEPHPEYGVQATTRSLNFVSNGTMIFKEPINWGDLHASEVSGGDTWEVILEEAAPDACPELCAYIKDWLEAWGWTPVVVRTEW